MVLPGRLAPAPAKGKAKDTMTSFAADAACSLGKEVAEEQVVKELESLPATARCTASRW